MYKHVLQLFALIISLNLSAQETPLTGNREVKQPISNTNVPKIQFGIKLSPSIAWIEAIHNDVQSEGATLKFGIGGIASFELTPLLSFVTGLNYNSFGGYVLDSASLRNSSVYETYKINYTEIEIPIALKLQTPYVNKTSYFVQGGFSIGFITSAKEKYYPVAPNAEPIYANINAYTSLGRIAYQIGAGVEYSVYRNSTVFGLISYNKSISNLANNTNPRYSSLLKLLPGSMEFSIGVKF